MTRRPWWPVASTAHGEHGRRGDGRSRSLGAMAADRWAFAPV
jgi:hypothetical protein